MLDLPIITTKKHLLRFSPLLALSLVLLAARCSCSLDDASVLQLGLAALMQTCLNWQQCLNKPSAEAMLLPVFRSLPAVALVGSNPAAMQGKRAKQEYEKR
jgi:hypothetical protein